MEPISNDRDAWLDQTDPFEDKPSRIRTWGAAAAIAWVIVFGIIAAYLSLIGCASHAPTVATPAPRHDAPFDSLPPAHLKSLEESKAAGR